MNAKSIPNGTASHVARDGIRMRMSGFFIDATQISMHSNDAFRKIISPFSYCRDSTLRMVLRDPMTTGGRMLGVSRLGNRWMSYRSYSECLPDAACFLVAAAHAFVRRRVAINLWLSRLQVPKRLKTDFLTCMERRKAEVPQRSQDMQAWVDNH